MTGQVRTVAGLIGLALLALATLPFVLHAFGRGVAGLAGDPDACDRFCWPDLPAVTQSIFAHMILGAAITLLVLVQVAGPVRRRFPSLHRWTGRITVLFGLATAAGGLAYMAGVGTVGGPVMTAGFTLYGMLMALAAVQTFVHARAKEFASHRRWALRLMVLALSSWLYRVHYALWYAATGGAGSAQDFSGPFDKVQVFAFFLPYLFVLELYLRRRSSAAVS